MGPSFASANLIDASGSWESSVNKKIFLLSQRVIDYCHAMRGLIWNMWDGNLTMRYTLPPPYCFWQDSTFITLYYRLHITVWDRNNLVIPRVLEHTSESQKHWLLDLPPEMLIQKVCSGVKNLHFFNNPRWCLCEKSRSYVLRTTVLFFKHMAVIGAYNWFICRYVNYNIYEGGHCIHVTVCGWVAQYGSY